MLLGYILSDGNYVNGWLENQFNRKVLQNSPSNKDKVECTVDLSLTLKVCIKKPCYVKVYHIVS